jgi:hypothetical protein
MAKTGYSAVTGGAVALAAATAKSIIGIKSNAAAGMDLRRIKLGYDGVTASAVPVLMELCYATFATNAPGTNSTSVTAVQGYGRVTASGFTAGKNWTAEPTVLTVINEYLLTPNGGLVFEEFPEGLDTALGEGYVMRCTAPAIVNVRATMWAERA